MAKIGGMFVLLIGYSHVASSQYKFSAFSTRMLPCYTVISLLPPDVQAHVTSTTSERNQVFMEI